MKNTLFDHVFLVIALIVTAYVVGFMSGRESGKIFVYSQQKEKRFDARVEKE